MRRSPVGCVSLALSGPVAARYGDAARDINAAVLHHPVWQRHGQRHPQGGGSYRDHRRGVLQHVVRQRYDPGQVHAAALHAARPDDEAHDRQAEKYATRRARPQVILDMDVNADGLCQEVEERIDEFATRGYRVLGVAMNYSGDVLVEQRQ